MVIELFRKIDFLSPPITLFSQGYKTIPSLFSGILSVITLIILILFSIYEIISLFKRDDETPKSTSFTYFKEDVGTITLDSSSLFHFISFEDYNHKGKEGFDFSYFNAIGIEEPVSFYEKNKSNIFNYNHWLYGSCNSDSDIKGIEDKVKNKFLTNSACLRKYYNKETKQYYETGNPNFKWPSIAHGTFHPENKLYSIIIKSCEQDILDILFNGKYNCKSIDEINSNLIVHLNFIDEYIDVLNYKDPVVKYSYRIENKYDKENYFVNHLNFNPAEIKSNVGYILDEDKFENSFFYERNDVLSHKKTNDICMAYSFYLNNRVRYYERTYKTIPEVLSIIGGNFNVIIFVMTFINEFINPFMILKDFNCLLNLFSITMDDIEKVNKRNILNKKLRQVEIIKELNCHLTSKSTKEKILKEVEEKEKELENDKETITNQTLNSQGSENIQEQKMNSNENKIENNENKESFATKPLNTILRFCDFLLYKITCGKRNKHFELMEIFRQKILSVEHLIQNYLMINGLLNLEKRRSKKSLKS